MASATEVKPRPRVQDIPLLKRWAIALDTCNCPDVLEADFMSRWLVISRACVFSMTYTSGFIGVLLALVLLGSSLCLQSL